MIEARLLSYPPPDRAEVMMDYLAELDRHGAQGTIRLEQLFSADGPAPRDQERTLSQPIASTTLVLVTACAGIGLPSGDRVIHRLLIIPESRVWHMTRVIPAPDVTGRRDRVTIAQLDAEALTVILGVSALGDPLTRSFCVTTGVA